MKVLEKKTNVEDILQRFPGKAEADLIPLLQEIQTEYGYISKESANRVSDYLNVATSKIYGVATFYNQFRLSPPGRHMIQVCRGTACHVKGSARLLDNLERELGIKASETTKDGRFSLEVVACIGACSIAPVICIDGNYHGRLKEGDLPKILEQYE